MVKLAELVEEVQAILGIDYEVSEANVKKNNGLVKKGLTIRKKDQAIAPTIYVGDDDTPESIVETYNGLDMDESIMSLIPSDISSKEYILANVFPVLCNKQKNENMLDDFVHTLYSDLVIMYRVSLDDERVSYLVRKNHIENREIDEQELHNAAMKNVKGKAHIFGVEYMLRKMGCPESMIDVVDDSPLKILTNENGLYGAGAILDEDIADQIGEDVYILPSSIHELIIVPANGDMEVNDLVSIVKEVNSTQLSPQEVLSDNVYVFRYNRMEVA